jgi:hypothetical protein
MNREQKIMSEPIIIKGKLYLEESLNTVWIYNDDDKYTNILDFLKTINLQRVTITVTVHKPEPSSSVPWA